MKEAHCNVREASLLSSTHQEAFCIQVCHVPEPECVHSLSRCAAEQFPHTLYLQHTQRVVRRLLEFNGSPVIKSTFKINWTVLTSYLFTSTLLGLDQPGCSIHTDNETTSDFGVKSPTVTRLLYPQNPPDPCNHLMRWWVRWFVQIDEARPMNNCVCYEIMWLTWH